MVVASKENSKRCPECGRERLIKFGMRWVRREGKRVKVQQFSCRDCGRITIKPLGGNE